MPKPPAPNPLLDDGEYREACRIFSWAENSRITEHWDDEGGDYVYPDGWPKGIDSDQSIAAQLDYEPAERAEATGKADSILHGLLHGK